jgi:hypothetical protein
MMIISVCVFTPIPLLVSMGSYLHYTIHTANDIAFMLRFRYLR